MISDIHNNETMELKRTIESLVRDHWDEFGKALLLSNLGKTLKTNYRTISQYFGASLRRFIETTHVATIVTHPVHSEKIGAIPLGVAAPSNLETLFSESAFGGRPRARPPLKDEFWELFHKTFAKKRYVIVSNDNSFRIDENIALGNNERSFEISGSDCVDIPSAPLPEKIEATWAKIFLWCDRNKLDVSLFAKERSKRIQENEVSSLPGLADRLSRLDQQDQSRIFIPFDIVIKMLSQK